MKINHSRKKALAVAWSTVLFVGMGMVAFAQDANGRKKKNAEHMDKAQHEQRMTAYRSHLNGLQKSHQQRMVQIQRENRTNQYQYQQQYSRQMLDQQRRYAGANDRNYRNDPYSRARFDRRYLRGGTPYMTNRYGIEHLQQSIQYGYAQGFQAGVADRRDRWRFDFADSDAYRDASYGFNGYYVSLDEYNFYFREGFRRGYEDGYYGRYNYGRVANGRYTVLKSILLGILPFELLRR